jgi:hypothetical protein
LEAATALGTAVIFLAEPPQHRAIASELGAWHTESGVETQRTSALSVATRSLSGSGRSI